MPCGRSPTSPANIPSGTTRPGLAEELGIRIDHLLLSPQASDRLIDVGIDSYVRAWEKPSDHVPVWIDLDFEAA